MDERAKNYGTVGTTLVNLAYLVSDIDCLSRKLDPLVACFSAMESIMRSRIKSLTLLPFLDFVTLIPSCSMLQKRLIDARIISSQRKASIANSFSAWKYLHLTGKDRQSLPFSLYHGRNKHRPTVLSFEKLSIG